MKEKRILFGVLILLAAMASWPRSTKCQVTYDTNHIRILDASLSDGTYMRLIVRRIAYTHEGTKRFLAFQSYDSNALSTQFLRSQSFLASEADTISVRRLLGIFGPGIGGTGLQKDSSITCAAFDSIVHSALSNPGYSSPSPALSAFDGSSNIKYIAELRNAATNAVLWSFDTVSMYRNSSGYLRYVTTGGSGDFRKIAVPSNAYGLYTYLAFRIVSVLPLGSTLTYRATLDDAERDRVGSQVDPVWSVQQENITNKVMTNGVVNNGANSINAGVRIIGPASANGIAILSVSPNPSLGSVNVTVKSISSETVNFQIVDMLGHSIYAQSAQVNPGATLVRLNIPDLPTGTYYIEALDEQYMAQYPVTILTH
jgi:hypothetical protein